MRAQTMDVVDFGIINPDFEQGHPPLIQFSYKFQQPWLKVAEGVLRIQDFESRNRLTTTAKVD